ncbi:hypothetical protein DWV91_06880 [Enterococcus asini]|nr:hypothetical protein DWV91_06880 [Enterococcus asini]
MDPHYVGKEVEIELADKEHQQVTSMASHSSSQNQKEFRIIIFIVFWDKLLISYQSFLTSVGLPNY